MFVQYYDLLVKDAVEKDDVDNKLNCIRLKWERHGGADEQTKKGTIYEILHLESLRERVKLIK